MTRHNKKRNVGLIYELMLRHISQCFINNEKNKIKKATNIIERRFAKNTELYKEFRLFSGLSRANITSTEVAAVIITETKSAISRIDYKKLEKEKSDLIREINYTIVPTDPNFYYRNIQNYSDYANIQNAINEWKKGDRSNFSKLIKLEEKVVNYLLKEKITKTPQEQLADLSNNNSNQLVYKILAEKINNKYNNLLPGQKKLIKEYALNHNDPDKLSKILKSYKYECLSSIDVFEKTCDNSYLKGQLSEVRKKVKNLDENKVDDSSMIKFLTIVKLINEFK